MSKNINEVAIRGNNAVESFYRLFDETEYAKLQSDIQKYTHDSKLVENDMNSLLYIQKEGYRQVTNEEIASCMAQLDRYARIIQEILIEKNKMEEVYNQVQYLLNNSLRPDNCTYYNNVAENVMNYFTNKDINIRQAHQIVPPISKNNSLQGLNDNKNYTPPPVKTNPKKLNLESKYVAYFKKGYTFQQIEDSIKNKTRFCGDGNLFISNIAQNMILMEIGDVDNNSGEIMAKFTLTPAFIAGKMNPSIFIAYKENIYQSNVYMKSQDIEILTEIFRVIFETTPFDIGCEN